MSNDYYLPSDPRDYPAYIREINDSEYGLLTRNMPRGVIPQRRGMSLAKSLAMEGTFPFQNFTPRALPSLVVSSTAACTSGVVTVTAAAHGIPATYADGFDVYYPGSPTLGAGWFRGLTRIDADTFTFLSPNSADFASESVNSGSAFVSEVTCYSMSIPSNTFVPGNIVTLWHTATAAGAGNKTVRVKYATTTLAANTLTSNRMTGVIGFSISGVAKQSGHSGLIGIAGTALNGTVDMTVDQTLSITGQSASAGGVLILHSSLMSIQ